MARADSSTNPQPPSGNKSQEPESHGPDVILDFIFEDGLFFISISNIGDKPAFKVSVKFDSKIHGLGGTKEISALSLFRNIEFFAPRKHIVTFLDHSGSYFSRKEPTKISARISYYDSQGTQHGVMIKHDLEIYREIAFINRPNDGERLLDKAAD